MVELDYLNEQILGEIELNSFTVKYVSRPDVFVIRLDYKVELENVMIIGSEIEFNAGEQKLIVSNNHDKVAEVACSAQDLDLLSQWNDKIKALRASIVSRELG